MTGTDYTADERMRRMRARRRELGYHDVCLAMTHDEEMRVRAMLAQGREGDPDAPWAWGKLRPRPKVATAKRPR